MKSIIFVSAKEFVLMLCISIFPQGLSSKKKEGLKGYPYFLSKRPLFFGLIFITLWSRIFVNHPRESKNQGFFSPPIWYPFPRGCQSPRLWLCKCRCPHPGCWHFWWGVRPFRWHICRLKRTMHKKIIIIQLFFPVFEVFGRLLKDLLHKLSIPWEIFILVKFLGFNLKGISLQILCNFLYHYSRITLNNQWIEFRGSNISDYSGPSSLAIRSPFLFVHATISAR